ncbi:MAG: hypothetical protein QOE96_3299, partial [Blastocatellia bacterium]|nr:hypothetical protein [Blastocatellia bacterium]
MSSNATRGTSPTVREGSSSTNLKTAAAKDLFVAPAPAPAVGTTLTTTLTGAITPTANNLDGKADPGDTITYTATITNTGASDATGLSFTDTVDPSTTLISGSGVMALDDHFNTIGNVNLNVPAAQGLLANDKDITSGNNTGMTASGGTTSAQGGTVAISSDGSFTYAPPVGFTGNDTFTYTATTSGGKTATATARIAIAGKIWFINNNAGACTSSCDGRLSHPFTSIANFNGVNDNGVAVSHPKTGDAIFIYESATSYTGPVTLLNNQLLIGQDATASLITITGLTQPSGTDPLPVMNAGNGTIVNIISAANAIPILVGNSNTLRGFTVGNTTGAKIISTGANFGTLTTNDLTLTGTGQALNLTSGTLAATFTNITSTSAASAAGISLATIAGTLTVSGTTAISNTGNEGIKITGSSLTANFGTTNVSAPGLSGIFIQTTTGNITFGATTITNGIEGIDLFSNSAGTRTFGSISITGSSANAINHSAGGNLTVTGTTTISCAGNPISVATPASGTLIDFQGATSATSTGVNVTGVIWSGAAGATMQFLALTIQTNGGIGLNATTGGTVTVTSGTGTINNTVQAASAIVASAVTLNANFSAIKSSGGTNGVSLTTVAGTSNFGGGTLSGASGATFLVNGSNGTVTYNGTITQGNAARVVDIQNKTGGTITLGGAISSTGGTGTGIIVNSNTGATINFTGGIALTTNANDAFTATGGGIVNLSGTNNITTTSGKGVNWSTDTSGTGVTFNNVNSTTGGAVVVASSGASNFTLNDVSSSTGTTVTITTATGAFVFHAITKNGGTTGIDVNGATGSFTVNGDSTTAGTGGTIQNTTSNGVKFVSSNNITLKNMNLTNNATSQSSTNIACGNNLVAGDTTLCTANLYLSSVTTITLNNLSITGSTQEGIAGTTVSALTLTNSTLSGNGNEDYEDGLLFKNLTGAVTITGTNVQNNFSRQAHIYNDAGSLTFNVTGSSFGRTIAPLTSSQQGLLMELHNSAHADVDIGTTSIVKNGNGNGLAITAVDSSTLGSSGTHSSLHNSTSLSENGAHVFISTGSNGVAYFDTVNNTVMTKAGLQAIDYFVGPNSTASGSITAVISGNTIGTTGVAGSACNRAVTLGGCDGMTIDKDGAGALSLRIQSNIIQQVETNGIALGTTQSNALNASIISNTIREPGYTGGGANAQGNAMLFNVGANSGSTTTACLNIGGAGVQNTIQDTASKTWDINGSGASIYFNTKNGTVTRQPGYGGTSTNDAAFAAFTTAQNSFTLVGGAIATLSTRFNGSTYAGGAACTVPLLLAQGGVESAWYSPSPLSTFGLSQLMPSATGPRCGASAEKAKTVTAPSFVASLDQQQVDSIVAVAIERWTSTGLTAGQIGILRGLKFDVTDLGGAYLGESNNSHVQIDRSAGGKGWYTSADSSSDTLFNHAVSATRRYTDPFSAPAGHVDLLTAIEHEMGHRLGLDDSYSPQDRDSIMYGYLTVGERRLPSRGQAKGAEAGSLASAHFLLVGSNDRFPAGDEFNSRGHRPRIDEQKGSDPERVASIRPLQGRNSILVGQPVALPPAIESHAFGVKSWGTSPRVSKGSASLSTVSTGQQLEPSLTVGLVPRIAANHLTSRDDKHSVPTARKSNHVARRTMAPFAPPVGGTITVSIGTLKPGDSVQITFQVT